MAVDPQERSTWRSVVRSAMRAASQLHGWGPTDLHVNQKSDYDDDEDCFYLSKQCRPQ